MQNWLSVPKEQLGQLRSVALPWEDRRAHNVYIAAPDFDYLDRTEIERLVSALRYHNFTPRRPIQENGQASPDATTAQKRQMCYADIALLKECSLVVAVLLNDDQGTLVEVGYALGRDIPVVVYDPYELTDNLMLAHAPEAVSPHLDEVVGAIFRIIAASRGVSGNETF